MNIVSILILAVILFLFYRAIRYTMKHGSCSECSGNCSSCHSAVKGPLTTGKDYHIKKRKI